MLRTNQRSHVAAAASSYYDAQNTGNNNNAQQQSQQQQQQPEQPQSAGAYQTQHSDEDLHYEQQYFAASRAAAVAGGGAAAVAAGAGASQRAAGGPPPPQIASYATPSYPYQQHHHHQQHQHHQPATGGYGGQYPQHQQQPYQAPYTSTTKPSPAGSSYIAAAGPGPSAAAAAGHHNLATMGIANPVSATAAASTATTTATGAHESLDEKFKAQARQVREVLKHQVRKAPGTMRLGPLPHSVGELRVLPVSVPVSSVTPTSRVLLDLEKYGWKYEETEKLHKVTRDICTAVERSGIPKGWVSLRFCRRAEMLTHSVIDFISAEYAGAVLSLLQSARYVATFAQPSFDPFSATFVTLMVVDFKRTMHDGMGVTAEDLVTAFSIHDPPAVAKPAAATVDSAASSFPNIFNNNNNNNNNYQETGITGDQEELDGDGNPISNSDKPSVFTPNDISVLPAFESGVYYCTFRCSGYPNGVLHHPILSRTWLLYFLRELGLLISAVECENSENMFRKPNMDKLEDELFGNGCININTNSGSSNVSGATNNNNSNNKKKNDLLRLRGETYLDGGEDLGYGDDDDDDADEDGLLDEDDDPFGGFGRRLERKHQRQRAAEMLGSDTRKKKKQGAAADKTKRGGNNEFDEDDDDADESLFDIGFGVSAEEEGERQRETAQHQIRFFPLTHQQQALAAAARQRHAENELKQLGLVSAGGADGDVLPTAETSMAIVDAAFVIRRGGNDKDVVVVGVSRDSAATGTAGGAAATTTATTLQADELATPLIFGDLSGSNNTTGQLPPAYAAAANSSATMYQQFAQQQYQLSLLQQQQQGGAAGLSLSTTTPAAVQPLTAQQQQRVMQLQQTTQLLYASQTFDEYAQHFYLFCTLAEPSAIANQYAHRPLYDASLNPIQNRERVLRFSQKICGPLSNPLVIKEVFKIPHGSRVLSTHWLVAPQLQQGMAELTLEMLRERPDGIHPFFTSLMERWPALTSAALLRAALPHTINDVPPYYRDTVQKVLLTRLNQQQEQQQQQQHRKGGSGIFQAAAATLPVFALLLSEDQYAKNLAALLQLSAEEHQTVLLQQLLLGAAQVVPGSAGITLGTLWVASVDATHNTTAVLTVAATCRARMLLTTTLTSMLRFCYPAGRAHHHHHHHHHHPHHHRPHSSSSASGEILTTGVPAAAAAASGSAALAAEQAGCTDEQWENCLTVLESVAGIDILAGEAEIAWIRTLCADENPHHEFGRIVDALKRMAPKFGMRTLRVLVDLAETRNAAVLEMTKLQEEQREEEKKRKEEADEDDSDDVKNSSSSSKMDLTRVFPDAVIDAWKRVLEAKQAKSAAAGLLATPMSLLGAPVTAAVSGAPLLGTAPRLLVATGGLITSSVVAASSSSSSAPLLPAAPTGGGFKNIIIPPPIDEQAAVKALQTQPANWSSGFESYPASGVPFPALPDTYTSHISASNGLYFFKEVSGGNNNNNNNNSGRTVTSYRHPVTKREYKPTPQAFFLDGGKLSVADFCRSNKQVDEARLQAWLANQAHRDQLLDALTLFHIKVKYPKNIRGATDVAADAAATAKGAATALGADSASTKSTVAITAAAERRRSRSPTSDRQQQQQQEKPEQSEPFSHAAMARWFDKYPASGPPFPALLDGGQQRWTFELSAKDGGHYVFKRGGATMTTMTMKHPVTNKQYRATPQAFFDADKEGSADVKKFCKRLGLQILPFRAYIANQAARDEKMDAALISEYGIQY